MSEAIVEIAGLRKVFPGKNPVTAVDGIDLRVSGRCHVLIRGRRVPIVGAVSMDSLGLDVSALPEGALRPGAMVDLIGRHRGTDAVAAEAGTIGYEILTRLGRRFRREYRDAVPSPTPSADLVLEGVPS